MSSKDLTLQEKSVKTRFISVFLALLVLIMYIPFPSLQIQATGDIVLTNNKVEFQNSSYDNIESVQSNEPFYIKITLAGNNVDQNNPESGLFRVYVDDDNMLLTNFENNGLTDGATYKLSGDSHVFTIHIEKDSDGKTVRYIEYNVQNGDTMGLYLNAKFADGKTADGEKCTFELVHVVTSESVKNIITAKAGIKWTGSKSRDKASVKLSDIENGTVINYNLSAKPQSSVGTSWVSGIKFNDTLSLPEGMVFNSDAE